MLFDGRITGKTRIAGLIGNPVEHSISPQLQNTISKSLGYDIAYVPFKVDKDNLENAVKGLKALNVIGFNVTIPFKSDIIKYIDEISNEASLIGAVNTVKNEDGKLSGYNTDAEGFKRSFIEETGESFANKSVAIIGAGGAAKALALKIAMDGPRNISIVNRTLSKAEEISTIINEKTGISAHVFGLDETIEKSLLPNKDIIINTTSLGMYPNTEGCPINDFSNFSEGQIFYDIIYNPPKTKLLKEAQMNGCKIVNGLGMLLYQGIYAYEIWTGAKLSEEFIDVFKSNLYSIRD